MIGRLIAYLSRPSAAVRQEAKALVDGQGARGAWLAASAKVRLAEAVDAEGDARHWIAVRQEIERQTGYVHRAASAIGGADV